MRRLVVVAMLLATGWAAVLGGAGAARAANECRGLQTCLPVTGPWVAIPAPTGGGASTVVWEMRCPLRGYIVAGIDARVSDRAIDVSIRGENGAPVSPGVTTGREVVFTAVYTGGAPRRRRSSRSSAASRPPAAERAARRRSGIRPRTRRSGRSTGASSGSAWSPVHPCGPWAAAPRARGSSARATPSRSARKPSRAATLLRAVSVRRTVAGRTVTAVAAVAPSVPQSLVVELQLHALCSRGTR